MKIRLDSKGEMHWFIYCKPEFQLENPGVQVTSATIETQGGQNNTLNTFWMQSDVDLSRGLDFSNRGPVYARFTHLNHRPFRYVWVTFILTAVGTYLH